ncbi:MAG: protein kinase [Methylibium sp.]|nr:protein kinase [Methylibium sp.]
MSASQAEIDPDALAPGTRLSEFEIERVLGIGGFGIVYLAFDHALERHVALKEYMPAALAARRGGTQIAVRSEAHAKTFGIGLRSFVNEARLLARFDHPALVKVYRFWEENGTAYMVMPYYEGQTLSIARTAMASPPNEDWLLALADAMLGALEALHREQVYHRDVAPDNILLQPDGAAVLLDFGAARLVISDRTQSLTAILKPNFAPIEQYGESSQLLQGPWTDLYSLAAVLHFCLIGRAPVPAALRMLHDELPSLLALGDELTAADGSRYSAAFLGAIDAALAVRPQARPQHAAAFRAALHGEPAPPVGAELIALPAKPQSGLSRAPFAPTEARLRRSGGEAAVTTAWATIGPRTDSSARASAAKAARAPGKRSVQAAAAVLAPFVTMPPRRLAMLGLAPVVLAALMGYSAMRPETPAAEFVESRAPLSPAMRAPSVAEPPPSVQIVTELIVEPAQTAAVPALVSPSPPLSAAPVAQRKVPPTTVASGETPPFALETTRQAATDEAVAAAADSSSARTQRARPVRAPAAAAQTARQSCGDRNFFSMQFCLQRQCSKPEFARDTECLDLLERQGNQTRPSF